MFPKQWHWFVLASAFLTLMFFQSVRQLIGSIWYVSLTSMGGTNPGVILLLLFLAPLLVYILKPIKINILMYLTAALTIVARIAATLVTGDLFPYMLANGLVILGFTMFLPCFLTVYFALNGKHRYHAIGGTVIAGPALAVLLDMCFRAFGDSLDISVGGLMDATAAVLVAPIVVVVFQSVLAVLCFVPIHKTINADLVSIRTKQRSGEPVSAILPGVGFGLFLMFLFHPFAHPDTLVRWTQGSYAVSVISTAVWLLAFIVILQIDSIRQHIFGAPALILLHAIFLYVLVDLLFLNTMIPTFIGGLALVALLVDMYVLFMAVGSRNYSVEPMIRMLTFGMLTFLVLFFLIGFTLLYAHTLGVFRDRLPIVLLISWNVLALIVFAYSKRVRSTTFIQEGEQS